MSSKKSRKCNGSPARGEAGFNYREEGRLRGKVAMSRLLKRGRISVGGEWPSKEVRVSLWKNPSEHRRRTGVTQCGLSWGVMVRDTIKAEQVREKRVASTSYKVALETMYRRFNQA